VLHAHLVRPGMLEDEIGPLLLEMVDELRRF